MKKFILFSITILMLVCGCGNFNEQTVLKEFKNDVNKSKSYILKGKMQIISNEEKFDYNLEVNYQKNNYYKVKLVNQTNNHEQVILRNDEGVYVVTPSLNKSFKFQSEWPDNSSQAYILNSLLKDLENDKELKLKKTDDNYILTAKVNYPNNSDLKYQKLYFDKKINLEKVEVYNDDDNISISVIIDAIDYKAGLEKEDFNLDDLIEPECCKKEEANCNNPCKEENSCTGDNCENKPTSSVLEDIIYPLYVPQNSLLTSSEKIDTEVGNRVILTFAGDKDFILVEETSQVAQEFEIIPIYGDPHILASSVVALGANSIYWTDNNVDYYLASNDLSGEEMLTIASSMTNSVIVSGSK